MMNRVTLAALATAGLCTAGANADDLLIVDLSVPNQVTVNATAGLSSASASGGDTTGVYLENFYAGPGGSLNESLVSGDLTNAENPTDNSPDLFRGGAGSDPGLNIWSWSSDATVTFTAGSLAFTGSGTWTLDADDYADMLAGASSGNLYFPADTADDIPNATQIGTYKVIIPAPGVATLCTVGLAFGMRRRRN